MKDIATTPAPTGTKIRNAIFLSLWRKYHLLNEITRECTKIYPANTDENFVKKASLKVSDLGYDIASDFDNPNLAEEVAPRINKSANRLRCLWRDANKRGIAPLTETGVILHIINEVKQDVKKLTSMTAA